MIEARYEETVEVSSVFFFSSVTSVTSVTGVTSVTSVTSATFGRIFVDV
jgi:hypothetical protein